MVAARRRAAPREISQQEHCSTDNATKPLSDQRISQERLHDCHFIIGSSRPPSGAR
jgi:hypothetical protein